MSAPGPLPEHFTRRGVDELDEVFSGANPNRTRAGCPAPGELAALARRERPLDDPGYAHIAGCSPCYEAMRALATAAPKQRLWRGALQVAGVAAAAVLALAVGVGLWGRSQQPAPLESGPDLRRNAATKVALDFRRSSAGRSVDAPPAAPRPELPKQLLDVTIYLPVGSEGGAYEAQLVDGANRRYAEATGAAAISAGITALPLSLDLRSVPIGTYQLAVRRQQESWRTFTVEVVSAPATPPA